jgi:hypothetical protein
MEIEKDIPIPETNESRASVLRRLNPGESFAVPTGQAGAWRTAMSKASERGDQYFISRTVFPGHVRIWRKA